MKRILIPFIGFAILYVVNACKSECPYPLYFQVAYIDPGTTIRVLLDNGVFEKTVTLKNGFYMSKENRYIIKENYCSSNELVKVYVKLNEYDTTMLFNKRKIKGCFVSTNALGRIRVHYDYYDGGMGEYKFED
jgi:hypothetical protein